MKYFFVVFLSVAIWSCNSNSVPTNNPASSNAADTIQNPIDSDVLSNNEFSFFRENEKEIIKSFKHSNDTLLFWDYVGGDEAPTGQWHWTLVFSNRTDFTFEGSMSEEGGVLEVSGKGSLLNESNCAKVLGKLSGNDDIGEQIDCNEMDSLGLIITDKKLFVQFMYLEGEMDKNEVKCDVSPRHGLDGVFTRRKNNVQ